MVAAATDVRTLVAARAVLRSLPDVPTGIVLRRGGFGVGEAVDLLGAPLLGVLPPVDGRPVAPDGLRRARQSRRAGRRPDRRGGRRQRHDRRWSTACASDW